jgi:hypothetical protein
VDWRDLPDLLKRAGVADAEQAALLARIIEEELANPGTHTGPTQSIPDTAKPD